MYVIVEWTLEGNYSLLSVRAIESPRKEFNDYLEGEAVTARYKQQCYPARIVKKSKSRAELEGELLPANHKQSKSVSTAKKAGVTKKKRRLESVGTAKEPDPVTKKKKNVESVGTAKEPNPVTKKKKNVESVGTAKEPDPVTKKKKKVESDADKEERKKEKETMKNQKELESSVMNNIAAQILKKNVNSRTDHQAKVPARPAPSPKKQRQDDDGDETTQLTLTVSSSPDRLSRSSRSGSSCSGSRENTPPKRLRSLTPTSPSILGNFHTAPKKTTSCSPNRSNTANTPKRCSPAKKANTPKRSYPKKANKSSPKKTNRNLQKLKKSRQDDDSDEDTQWSLVKKSLDKLNNRFKHKMDDLDETFDIIIGEMKKIKKRVKTLESKGTSTNPPTTSSSSSLYNGKSKEELARMIINEKDEYSAVKQLLLQFFSIEYICNHSVTGRSSNSKMEPKPGMDEQIINLIRQLIKEKFGAEKVTVKIQNVQKLYRKKKN